MRRRIGSGRLSAVAEVSPEGFVRAAGPDGPVVTRAALKLHTYAILVSIEVGHPGFISDEYLGAIQVETSVTALELTLSGLWRRTKGGYRVSERETLRVAGEVHRQLLALDESER